MDPLPLLTRERPNSGPKSPGHAGGCRADPTGQWLSDILRSTTGSPVPRVQLDSPGS
jgi:hypothetical protein